MMIKLRCLQVGSSGLWAVQRPASVLAFSPDALSEELEEDIFPNDFL